MCCTIYFLIVYSAQSALFNTILKLIPHTYPDPVVFFSVLIMCFHLSAMISCLSLFLTAGRHCQLLPLNPVHFSIPYPSYAAHESCVKTSSHAMLDWFMPLFSHGGRTLSNSSRPEPRVCIEWVQYIHIWRAGNCWSAFWHSWSRNFASFRVGERFFGSRSPGPVGNLFVTRRSYWRSDWLPFPGYQSGEIIMSSSNTWPTSCAQK